MKTKEYLDAYKFWVNFVKKEKLDLQKANMDVKQVLTLDLHNHLNILNKMAKNKSTLTKDLISKTAMVQAYRNVLKDL